MARIGFVGVGNMGGPMALNLLKAGHAVKVFDLSQTAVENCVDAGAEAAASAADAASDVSVVITMLPRVIMCGLSIAVRTEFWRQQRKGRCLSIARPSMCRHRATLRGRPWLQECRWLMRLSAAVLAARRREP